MKQSSGDLQNRKIREMLKQMIERDQVVPLAGTCQIGEGRPPDGKAPPLSHLLRAGVDVYSRDRKTFLPHERGKLSEERADVEERRFWRELHVLRDEPMHAFVSLQDR